jgi:copper homeostasis protein (lipoprotein)
MRCNLLVALSLTLSLVVGCARDEASTEQPSADASPQSQADADPTTVASTMPAAHNSKNSLDWAGSYSGVVPCASCPGIETRVTLHAGGTFDRSMHYIDESPVPNTDSGAFTWNAGGSKVTLGTGNDAQQYQVGENRLFHLDRSGERITGDLAGQYVLEKHIHDPTIEDRRWKLVELHGKPIESSEAALTLRAEDSVTSGNASCNTFTGGYAIKNGRRIRFERNMAVTMMACPDMTIETSFLETLQQVDNYAVGQDGMLSLNRARMAPLVRFVPDGGP